MDKRTDKKSDGWAPRVDADELDENSDSDSSSDSDSDSSSDSDSDSDSDFDFDSEFGLNSNDFHSRSDSHSTILSSSFLSTACDLSDDDKNNIDELCCQLDDSEVEFAVLEKKQLSVFRYLIKKCDQAYDPQRMVTLLAHCYNSYNSDPVSANNDEKIAILKEMMSTMCKLDHAAIRDSLLEKINVNDSIKLLYTASKKNIQMTSAGDSDQVIRIICGDKSPVFFKPGSSRYDRERFFVEFVKQLKTKLSDDVSESISDFLIPLFPYCVDGMAYQVENDETSSEDGFDILDAQGNFEFVMPQKGSPVYGGIQCSVDDTPQQQSNRQSLIFMHLVVMLFGLTDLSGDNYQKGYFLDIEEMMQRYSDDSMAFDLSFLSIDDLTKPLTFDEIAFLQHVVTQIEDGGLISNPRRTSPRSTSPSTIFDQSPVDQGWLFRQTKSGKGQFSDNFECIQEGLQQLTGAGKLAFNLADLAKQVSPVWGNNFDALNDLSRAVEAIASKEREKKEGSKYAKLDLQDEELVLKLLQCTAHEGGRENDPGTLYASILRLCNRGLKQRHLLAGHPDKTQDGGLIKEVHAIIGALHRKVQLGGEGGEQENLSQDVMLDLSEQTRESIQVDSSGRFHSLTPHSLSPVRGRVKPVVFFPVTSVADRLTPPSSPKRNNSIFQLQHSSSAFSRQENSAERPTLSSHSGGNRLSRHLHALKEDVDFDCRVPGRSIEPELTQPERNESGSVEPPSTAADRSDRSRLGARKKARISRLLTEQQKMVDRLSIPKTNIGGNIQPRITAADLFDRSRPGARKKVTFSRLLKAQQNMVDRLSIPKTNIGGNIQPADYRCGPV